MRDLRRSYHIISYQLKLIKVRAELANLNNCAVPFLSRAAVNLCWYNYIQSISKFKTNGF